MKNGSLRHKLRIPMKDDLVIQEGIVIPGHELEFATSRAGGPGGQHVNKSNTRITVRWNLVDTSALDENQKNRVLNKLANELTTEGEIIIHNASSRSQMQNKKAALSLLAEKIRNALHVPKKRMKSKMPKGAKEARLQSKKKHSALKKSRSKKDYF